MADYKGFFENFPPLKAVEDDADFVLKVFDERNGKDCVIAFFKDNADEHVAGIAFIAFAKQYFNVDVEIERV